jgi:hypothetical protein
LLAPQSLAAFILSTSAVLSCFFMCCPGSSFSAGLHPSVEVDYVDRARQTRVKGVDGAQNLKWPLRVRDRRLYERRFVRAALAVGVSRARIPRGRDDSLIITDGLVRDLHPMS